MVMLLPGCAAISPRETGVERRLAALTLDRHALERPVTIRWNDHLVPWIEAETDGDLPYALGLVHVHLRAGQILTLRNIARGRVAEMAGPPATELDHALRLLDFARAAPAIEAAWPAETRAFVARFLGKNNFARRFRDARRAAGLPDTLQFRDLRRTAMVRLAEAGATLAQIAAISGHSIETTQKILEHHVPRTRLMALAAMDRLIETGGDRGLRRGFALLQAPVGQGAPTAG
jgi:integrase